MKLLFGRVVVITQMALVIFLLVLAVITNSSFLEHLQRDYSQNEAYCYTDRDAAEHQKAKECQGLYYKTLDDPVALFTGLLVVFTGVLAVVTYALFSVAARESGRAEEAIEIARSSAKAATLSANAAVSAITGNRAWLLFDMVNINEIFNDNEKRTGLVLTVSWKNFGHTPAFSTKNRISAVLIAVEGDLPYFKDLPDSTVAHIVPIAPSKHVFTSNVIVDEIAYNGFMSGKAIIVVYSKIQYRDIYNVDAERMSEVCVRIFYNGIAVDPLTNVRKLNFATFVAGIQNSAT